MMFVYRFFLLHFRLKVSPWSIWGELFANFAKLFILTLADIIYRDNTMMAFEEH